LGDENTTVRAAAAAALGRLALGGLDCLRDRLKIEANADVRDVLTRALDRVPVEIPASAQYYVAIGEPTNDTTRSTEELSRVVRSALRKQISSLSGFVIAPLSETPQQAQSVLSAHPKLKPIFVWPKVKAIYADGALQVVFDLSLFTYPGKAFKGNMTRKLTMPDISPGDVASEDELIQMAAERLAPDLAQTAPKI
jgi:hypothetical protein